MDAVLHQTTTRLSSRERLLLLLPLVGSTFVGLFLFLFPTVLASLSGFSGNDLYVYRLAGAGTFGYPVALALGLRENNWAALRLVVLAFFTFGIGSLYACFADIVNGNAHPVVYVVLILTLLFMAITGTILYMHRGEPKLVPDIANWLVYVLIVATLAAAFFGLSPLLFPELGGHFFGFKATDIFIFRQSGASSLGYAVMGVFQLRSRRWLELRLPVVMATVFNGLAFVASLVAIATGESLLIVYLIGLVSLGVTMILLVALRREGK